MEAIPTRADLLDVTGEDPWVRWGLPEQLGEMWLHRGVVMVVQRGRRALGFWVTGVVDTTTEADVRAALVALRDDGILARSGAEGLSIEQRWSEVVPSVVPVDEGGRWEWYWTTCEPAEADLAGRAGVADPTPLVQLDDTADGPKITEFLRAHNPRVWMAAGGGDVRRWVAIRGEDGGLLAVGGATVEPSGAAHLVSIVTHSDHRGRGLGRRISAALTREAVRADGVCTLGMYSDNAPARAVYQSLGYRLAHAWHSRSLLAGSATPTA